MMPSEQQSHDQHRDPLSCVIYELSALVLNLLRSPPTPVPTKISAVGFAWLMLGISVSLMLCGSVTFFLGFMLMPWVLGLLMFFYVAGLVSTISMLGRSILCYAMAPPSPTKASNDMEVLCFASELDKCVLKI
ncbi:hypothetical protein Goarm_009909 [Gossypium armourianum]|uniref:Uncharacterized protein n=1 Tax=Gossypium armourianum TaxID=34283 RepID=A0A7J9JUD6_9ROSI|nr:hypothetical protein [Gossypium armourianum]